MKSLIPTMGGSENVEAASKGGGRRTAMGTKRNKWFLRVIVLPILGMVYFNSSIISAAPPEGVLKQAIHWSVSADWLDPSSGHPGTLGWFPLQLFHDALVKTMPEGL